MSDSEAPRSKLRAVAIIIVCVVVVLVVLALAAEQASFLPFEYEGF
jgi:flagellar basal body-associated protein FliL